VVMYAISSINEGKFRVLSDSLQAAFRGTPKSLQPVQMGQKTRGSGADIAMTIVKQSMIEGQPREMLEAIHVDESGEAGAGPAPYPGAGQTGHAQPIPSDHPIAQQLAFLNLHPELAGKEAEAGTMTDHSTAEQAGLSALETSEVEALRQLNAQYAARHGFPFVIAVLANTKSQIFEALRRRIAEPTDSERKAALAQIGIITRLRLGRLFAAA